MSNEVFCPYCDQPALRMTGRELYPAKPILANKHYHVCRNCDAWIGCKDGTWEPNGRLADSDLRRAKQDAHAAIDPICLKAMKDHDWSKNLARNVVYEWLAAELDIPGRVITLGDFDLRQCELVLLICQHRDPELNVFNRSRNPANHSKRRRPGQNHRYEGAKQARP